MLEAPDLGRGETGVLGLPAVEGLFRNAVFAADFLEGDPELDLLQNDGDLLFGKAAFLQFRFPWVCENFLTSPGSEKRDQVTSRGLFV